MNLMVSEPTTKELKAVTVDPPKSVREMEQILEAFLQPGEVWKIRYKFGL